jgi:diguanylate cyclase (GGDEF)-like protein
MPKMPVEHPRYSLSKFAAAAVIGMAVLAGSVVLGVETAVDRAVSADARARAEDWARYFIDSLPGVDRLLAGGALDAQQKSVVATAAKVGNVFRFKLYGPMGKTIVQSDAESFGKDEDDEHVEDEVFDVIKDHQPVVSLNDGTRERDMPALYAEAYVPVFTAGGAWRAVVETYVDETKTAAFFKTSFATLAAVLGIGMALAFGIPTLAFLIRTRQAREVKHRADYLENHDRVTNLLNRAGFVTRLGQKIAAARPGSTLALAMFDIDDFKAINDAFGHAAGDEFLKHVAHAIGRLGAPGDFMARAGSDQFMLALSRPDADAVLETVEAMREALREPLHTAGRRVCARASAGIALIEAAGEGVEDAIQHAELALYQSKIDGKNTSRLFSFAMEADMRARRQLEQLVRAAAAEHRFELYYQPLLAAASKECLGFEALLRLRGADGELVPPMTFIPVAEQIGLIDEIGTWALMEATRTAATWPAPLFVSVNLSVRQFVSGELTETVRTALAASGLAPERLELEVTESLLMDNTESVARQLKALKALGVSIAMDDFGTGYSSLAYLWQFGFDKLKIDRSFVTALGVDAQKAREVLDTIVMLAHRLGMRVTAEGIETERQAAVLEILSCDQFQGYLYGRPAPVGDLAPLLRPGTAEMRTGTAG